MGDGLWFGLVFFGEGCDLLMEFDAIGLLA